MRWVSAASTLNCLLSVLTLLALGSARVRKCARRTHSFGMLCLWMGALQIQ